MPDDTLFDACVAGAGSLTDSALAALALLVPPGAPDAPELDWLRQHAGSVPALSRTHGFLLDVKFAHKIFTEIMIKSRCGI